MIRLAILLLVLSCSGDWFIETEHDVRERAAKAIESITWAEHDLSSCRGVRGRGMFPFETPPDACVEDKSIRAQSVGSTLMKPVPGHTGAPTSALTKIEGHL
jgi:hypothetical protein